MPKSFGADGLSMSARFADHVEGGRIKLTKKDSGAEVAKGTELRMKGITITSRSASSPVSRTA